RVCPALQLYPHRAAAPGAVPRAEQTRDNVMLSALRNLPALTLMAGVAAILCIVSPALADDFLGTLQLPEATPSLPGKKQYDLLAPPVVNSSWAQPGAHPLGVGLPSFDLTPAQIDAVRDTGCGLVRLAIPFEPFAAALDANGEPMTDPQQN